MAMADGHVTTDSPRHTKLNKVCARLQLVENLPSGEKRLNPGAKPSARTTWIANLISMLKELDTCTPVHVLSTMMLMLVVTVTQAGLATTKSRLRKTTDIIDLKVSARVHLESNSQSGDTKTWVGA